MRCSPLHAVHRSLKPCHMRQRVRMRCVAAAAAAVNVCRRLPPAAATHAALALCLRLRFALQAPPLGLPVRLHTGAADTDGRAPVCAAAPVRAQVQHAPAWPLPPPRRPRHPASLPLHLPRRPSSHPICPPTPDAAGSAWPPCRCCPPAWRTSPSIRPASTAPACLSTPPCWRRCRAPSRAATRCWSSSLVAVRAAAAAAVPVR